MINYIMFNDRLTEDRGGDYTRGRCSRCSIDIMIKKLNDWLISNDVEIINVETKIYPIPGYNGANDGQLIVWYKRKPLLAPRPERVQH